MYMVYKSIVCAYIIYRVPNKTFNSCEGFKTVYFSVRDRILLWHPLKADNETSHGCKKGRKGNNVWDITMGKWGPANWASSEKLCGTRLRSI